MFHRVVWLVLGSFGLSLALIGFAGCSDGGGEKACEDDSDCDSSSHCEAGDCVPYCPERPCLVGQLCFGGFCYEKDCETRTCPGFEDVCLDGRCVGTSCIGVVCDSDKRCAGGDCYPENCPDQDCLGYDEVCLDGECVVVNCIAVECPPTERCAANGFCYPEVCDETECPVGQVCFKDECQEPACVGVVCEPGTLCGNGYCWPVACGGQACPEGEVCENDACVASECVQGRCDNPCEPDEQPEVSCADGKDNDCDELIDCADITDCEGAACDDGNPETGGETCSAGICVFSCEPDEQPEASCGDGRDNDCDGLTDCADLVDCEMKTCDDGDPQTNGDRCLDGICCDAVERCEQCETGECQDVLVDWDDECGGSQSNPPCADTWEVEGFCDEDVHYTVTCWGEYNCYYQREKVTEECNCAWECR